MDDFAATLPVPNLFARLPGGLFRPLATDNRELVWELLLRLYDTFFGPDATQGGAEGYLKRTITQEVERFLVDTEGRRPWHPEAGLAPDTPLAVQANYHLERLIDTGWLREESIGVRKLIVMTPAIQKFLELLLQFAEEGPKLVGGKVLNIYNNLLAIAASPAQQAGALHETAKDARSLVSSLSSTGIRVRELMERLNEQDSTSAYIASFFQDYVTNFFIRDYYEMRTENHPLRHRHDILRIVGSFRDNPTLRHDLIDGYRNAFKTATHEEAEALFERDITRLKKFEDIQLYLARLDDSISRANRQALALISYKLRNQGRIEVLIAQTIEALTTNSQPTTEVLTSLAPGPLFSANRLREPSIRPPEPEVRTMRRAVMSPEQRALSELRRAMRKAREVTRSQIKRYVDAHIALDRPVSSDHLPIVSVADLVVFLALSRGAFLTRLSRKWPRARTRQNQHLQLLRGLALESVDGAITTNDFVSLPRFIVTRTEEF